MNRPATVSLIAGLTALPAKVVAGVAQDTTYAAHWAEPAWGSMLKMVLVLALVIALIWISLALLKRVMGVRGVGVSGVDIIGGIPLGPRRAVQFMLVGEELYLLGVTDHTVGLIGVIRDRDEIARITTGGTGRSDRFASILRKFTGRGGRQPDGDASPN